MKSAIDKNETHASIWDSYYQRDIVPWRSKGLSQIVVNYIKKYSRGHDSLEIGCGTGEDAQGFIKLGLNYLGLDVSLEAILLAKKKVTRGIFLVADFFGWKSDRKYSIVYDKGAFHNLAGSRRRKSFIRRVASVLTKDGIWITVCGSADHFDPAVAHGAVFLQHIITPAEPYFEVLEVVKAPYQGAVGQFDGWYCVFRRR